MSWFRKKIMLMGKRDILVFARIRNIRERDSRIRSTSRFRSLLGYEDAGRIWTLSKTNIDIHKYILRIVFSWITWTYFGFTYVYISFRNPNKDYDNFAGYVPDTKLG